MNRPTTPSYPISETGRLPGTVVRLRGYVKARREAAQADRQLAAVLAGQHGPTMREEVLEALNR